MNLHLPTRNQPTRNQPHVGTMWLLALSVALAALVVTACGGSGGDATAVDTSSTSDGPESFEDIDFSSPIGDFLGYDFSNDDFEAEILEQQRIEGRLTAECMQALGFDFTPMDPGDMISFGSPGDIPYGSDEWVETYGFGVTTQRFPQSDVGDLVGFPDDQMNGPGQDFVDPNADYLESLGDAEREAWQVALYGPPIEFDESGPPEDFRYEPQGCQGEAMRAAGEELGRADDQLFYETFRSELDGLYERVQADPRIVEFNDDLTACMSDKGLVWVDEQEVYERFESRLEGLQPAGWSGGDPLLEAGLDPETMSERELEDFYRDLNRLDPSQLQQLAALQAEELELARALKDCGGGPLRQAVLFNEVQAEYEQEFLDANADALADFAAD